MTAPRVPAPRSPAAVERLRSWADENFLAGFALLSRHQAAGPARDPRRFGGAVAFATGRPDAFFNPIVVLQPVAAADLRAAIEWMSAIGGPCSIRVREDLDEGDVRAVAEAAGLVRDPWADPAMVMQPLGAAPPAPAGLSIEEADPADPDRFYAANASGFEIPSEALAIVRQLTPPSVFGDPAIRLFGGYLDGDPVACSYAIRSGSVVGVYAVGTAARARRRGIGTAMTWAAVEAGRAWGCEAATLQASPMGEPVYRAMGFETVTRYVNYEPPKTGRAG